MKSIRSFSSRVIIQQPNHLFPSCTLLIPFKLIGGPTLFFSSALETELVTGQMGPVSLRLRSWPNFIASNCPSAVLSEVKTFPETAFIQSKRRKCIIKELIISSHKLHSRKPANEKYWLRILISTKCRQVFLNSGSWGRSGWEFSRFPSFAVFERNNVNARLGCGNEMTYVLQSAIFLWCVLLNSLYSFFQLVPSSFSCPPAAISSQFTRWVNLTTHDRKRYALKGKKNNDFNYCFVHNCWRN